MTISVYWSGRIAAGLRVAEANQTMAESRLRAPTLANGLALRAKVILAKASNEGVRPLAHRLGVLPNTVVLWRRALLHPRSRRAMPALCAGPHGLPPLILGGREIEKP